MALARPEIRDNPGFSMNPEPRRGVHIPRMGVTVSIPAPSRPRTHEIATKSVAFCQFCFVLSTVTVSRAQRRNGEACSVYRRALARAGLAAACASARTPRAGAGREGLPHHARASLPAVGPRLESRRSGSRLIGEHRRDHRVDSRKLIVGRAAGDDAHDGCRGAIGRVAHSGMFPCFLGGRLARLPLRARRALMIATRVAAGSMMPSSSPRSAARNGLATL